MKPTPWHVFGHEEGSQSFSLNVRVSPDLILPIRLSYQVCMLSATTLVSSVLAAVLPSVENSASTGTFNVESV